jgi:hypothetical protein
MSTLDIYDGRALNGTHHKAVSLDVFNRMTGTLNEKVAPIHHRTGVL